MDFKQTFAARNIEDTIPEIEGLLGYGVLTHSETQEVVRTRRDFESKLIAKESRVEHFRRAILYELQLQRLIDLRLERTNIQIPKDHIVAYGRSSRILRIYQDCVRKMPGIIEMWKEYINYMKSNRHYTRLACTLADALRLHPLQADLWIFAASFEIQVNNNFIVGREIMQRSLRIMPQNTRLWQEYFRFEMLYSESIRLELFNQQLSAKEKELTAGKKLKKAKSEMSDEEEENDEEGQEHEEEEADEMEERAQIDMGQLPGASDSEQTAEAAAVAAATAAAKAKLLTFPIAQIIYTNACKAIPSDSQFRCSLLATAVTTCRNSKQTLEKTTKLLQMDVAQRTRALTAMQTKDAKMQQKQHKKALKQCLASSLAGLRSSLQKLVESISQDIHQTFSGEPAACRGLAELHLQFNMRPIFSGVKGAIQVFEDAVQSNPEKAELWQEYFTFCGKLSQTPQLDQSDQQEKATVVADSALQRCLAVFRRAGAFSTPSMHKDAAGILLRFEKVEEAVEVLQNAVSRFPDNLECKEYLIQLSSRIAPFMPELASSIGSPLSLLKAAAKASVQMKLASLEASMRYMASPSSGCDEVQIAKAFQDAIRQFGSDTCTETLRLHFLTWSFVSGGTKRARFAADFCLEHPPISLPFLRQCIEFELCSPNPDKTRLRLLHERTTDSFGRTNWSIWIDFIRFELESGDANRAQTLHWKAQRTLADVEEFNKAYEQLK